jgi:uncharacterized protein (DUF427 family)
MALRMRHHLGTVMGELRYEPTVTRVRAFVGDEPVVDSRAALLVWEPRRLVPVYAVAEGAFRYGVRPAHPQPPPADLAGQPRLLGPTDFGLHTCPGTVLDVGTPNGSLPAAGFRPDDPDLGGADLDGVVLLDFAAFDSWLVEDEPRVGHPHDPFKRISVHASDRHVRVSLGDTVLGDTTRALMLLETHLPPRWYLPMEDVRLDLLVPSNHTSTCAYKGHAAYFSLPGVAENIGWHYPEPLDDARRVAGHMCFWSERTDLTLDGLPQSRPVTPWSTREEQEAAAADRLEFG